MKFLVLIASILLSQLAFSAPIETTETTETLKISSKDIRAKKRFMVAGEVIGQGPSGAYGQGVNFGILFNDRSMLTIELNGGRSSIGESSDSDGNYLWDGQEIKSGYSFGVGYKHFLANSFYIKTGLDLRTFQYKYVNTPWNSSSAATSRKFSGDSAAVSFSVGNQWQYDYFTMGCDWFGLEAPFVSRIYDVSYSSNTTGADREDHRRDMNRYVTGLGATFLRFYLGATF